jgi:hypothetical protein
MSGIAVACHCANPIAIGIECVQKPRLSDRRIRLHFRQRPLLEKIRDLQGPLFAKFFAMHATLSLRKAIGPTAMFRLRCKGGSAHMARVADTGRPQ